MRINIGEVTRRFITDPERQGEAFLVAKINEESDAYMLDGSWFEQTSMRPSFSKHAIILVPKEKIGDWAYLDGDRASAQYGNDFRSGVWKKISEVPYQDPLKNLPK